MKIVLFYLKIKSWELGTAYKLQLLQPNLAGSNYPSYNDIALNELVKYAVCFL